LALGNPSLINWTSTKVSRGLEDSKLSLEMGVFSKQEAKKL